MSNTKKVVIEQTNQTSETVAPKTTSKKANDFVSRALQNLNKDEATIQREKVVNFRIDALVDGEEALQLETLEMQRTNNSKVRALNEIDKAQQAYDLAKSTPASDFSEYFNKMERAMYTLNEAKNGLELVNNKIKQHEYKIERIKEVISYLD